VGPAAPRFWAAVLVRIRAGGDKVRSRLSITDKEAGSVQKLSIEQTERRAKMSRPVTKASGKPARKPDRRVRETREALGDALVKLMHETPFEEITVQHILDGAGVGRSTFYTHFSDKNDLFLSDVEEFFGMMASALSQNRDKSRRLAPVREMFEHAAAWRPFLKAMAEAGKIQDVMEIGRECFARGIERRMEEMGAKVRASRSEPREGQLDRGRSGLRSDTAISQMLAGSLMALLSWWLHGGRERTAAEMDDLFHELALGGISKTTN
jgi:AcrR family transcriptional regulator